MRKVIVNEFMSLDGVAQAPGGADEDTSGGFAHGGWHMQYMEDELAMRWVLESIFEAGGFLLGRRTYEIFARSWGTGAWGEDQGANPVSEALNNRPKYVVSTTLTDPQWPGTTVLGGEHEPAQLDYFLCGPPGLIHDTLEALDALGVPEHRVHTEQFDMA